MHDELSKGLATNVAAMEKVQTELRYAQKKSISLEESLSTI